MTTSLIQDRAVALIEQHLGSIAAEMYHEHFQKISEDDVVKITQELLTELIGEHKAIAEMAMLRQA